MLIHFLMARSIREVKVEKVKSCVQQGIALESYSSFVILVTFQILSSPKASTWLAPVPCDNTILQQDRNELHVCAEKLGMVFNDLKFDPPRVLNRKQHLYSHNNILQQVDTTSYIDRHHLLRLS